MVEHRGWQSLRAGAFEHWEDLFAGADSLYWVDFPDYANVGDSLIFAGQLRWAAETGRTVTGAASIRSLDLRRVRRQLDRGVVLAFTGGGNFGGLYPVIQRQRLRLLDAAPAGATIVQAPQSIHFPTDAQEAVLRDAIARHPGYRLGVRDRPSLEQARRLPCPSLLAPDAIHFLRLPQGQVDRGSTVVLARTDGEADPGDRGCTTAANDWLKEPVLPVLGRQMAHLASKALLGRLDRDPMSMARWAAVAEARIARGMAVIGAAETVVTNRLHGMLLALALGRRVIAVDNANHKLSAYHATWLRELDLPVEFRGSMAEALR